MTERGRFDGVLNVVRFNWPSYAATTVGIALAVGLGFPVVAALLALPALASLVATWWVYDASDLYELPWLAGIDRARASRIVVVTAGFDEIGAEIARRLPRAEVTVVDVFDPERTPERSIERARRVHGAEGARPVDPAALPIGEGEIDLAVAFLSAHELRDRHPRIALFLELRRALARDGMVVVVEHQRDFANTLAYSVGVLHFLPRRRWLETFAGAGLRIRSERRHTPLVRVFELVPA